VFDNALFCGQGCPEPPAGILYVGVMTAIPIVTAALGVAQNYLAKVFGQRVMQDLRNSLYAHLQRMPLQLFTRQKPTRSSPVSPTVGSVQTVVAETAASILSNTVALASTVVAMLITFLTTNRARSHSLPYSSG
jgi:ATP-binding cassette subfamily B protein